jgi:hypothetical protein
VVKADLNLDKGDKRDKERLTFNLQRGKKRMGQGRKGGVIARSGETNEGDAAISWAFLGSLLH